MPSIGRAAAFAFLIASIFALISPVAASVSLTVQPLVAEFNTAPGKSDSIPVTVTNSGSEPARFTVRRTDWRTTADGSIALEKVGTEGVHSLSRDLSLSSYQFVLQAGEQRQLRLGLSVPANSASNPRSYWGGYFINATALNARPGTVGLAATVFVYNTVGNPRRHITMQSLRVNRGAGGTASIVARLRNDSNAYCRPTAHVLVEQAGRILQDRKVNISTVFPNTTRFFAESVGYLRPGSYHVELTIDYGGDAVIQGTTDARI